MTNSLENNTQFSNSDKQYSFGKFLLVYLAAIMICIIGCSISLFLLPVIYIVCGIALTRFYGRRLKWWAMSNTIDTVFKVKRDMIFLWIVLTPKFLVKFLFTKFL